MPLYEYSCSKCGHKFERLAKAQDEAEAKCPGCGSKEVKKVLGGFSSFGSGCGSAPSAPYRPAPRHFG